MNGAGAAARNIGAVILDVKNISLSFGGVKALQNISFDVNEHEVRAIIGPNGAGKSSMLNVHQRRLPPSRARSSTGEVRRDMDTPPPRPASAAPSRTWRCSRA